MRLGLEILAGAAMSAALAVGTPAAALDRDRVYADSYGNLVIESAAGSKRILVGEGHAAARVADYVGAGQPSRSDQPEVIYSERTGKMVINECYRPPVLVKGRSYMYGFDQGEIPLQGGPCQ